MSKRLVFFGNERLVSGLKHTDAPILRGLIAAEYEIVAVVVNHEQARSRSARKLEVADVAHEYGIPVLSPAQPSDIAEELTRLTPDGAVLVAYGRIIPERIINVFGQVGIINVHPSLLPRYRGSTPIESAILAGDLETGVSIMRLDTGMDTGPLFAQSTLTLRGNETKFELYESLAARGLELLLTHLPDILDSKVIPIPQQNDGVSYTTMLSKKDSVLNPLTDDAYALERKVRAYAGYPKARLHYGNNDVIVTSAKVTDSLSSDSLTVECMNATYLEVTELIAPSGKTMSGEAYLRGYAA